MQITDTIKRSKAVVFTELDGEVVMLDTDKGKYYELDLIGSRIWALLEERTSLSALRDVLITEFEVDQEQCLNDLSDFIVKLVQCGLVVECCVENMDQ